MGGARGWVESPKGGLVAPGGGWGWGAAGEGGEEDGWILIAAVGGGGRGRWGREFKVYGALVGEGDGVVLGKKMSSSPTWPSSRHLANPHYFCRGWILGGVKKALVSVAVYAAYACLFTAEWQRFLTTPPQPHTRAFVQ